MFESVKASVAAQALNAANGTDTGSAAVRVRGIVESTSDPTERYEPGNPLANADGNVYSPNVNVIEEMTDMISASRAYQNNVEVMNTSRN